MHNGVALQGGTSHYFGDGWAKNFGITFTGRDNTLQHPYQTSWGVSTRMIGAIIMVHGDDNGLALPPKVAPYPARDHPDRAAQARRARQGERALRCAQGQIPR